jgi:hypothetical protein
MTTRRTIRAIVPGAIHGRPEDGFASLAYGRPKDGVASLAYARPDAALILGGLLLLICP